MISGGKLFFLTEITNFSDNRQDKAWYPCCACIQEINDWRAPTAKHTHDTHSLHIGWSRVSIQKPYGEVPLNPLQFQGNHPAPFLLFFYKVYKRPLTPPPRFIKLRCEFFENTFTTFFPLNMIPWYPKQILLHCEEAEKFIFDMPQKTFSMPISCCQSPPEYTKFTS